MKQPSPHNGAAREKSPFVFFLFLGLVVLIYSNTLDAAWHLDDAPNITNDASLHFDRLDASALFNTFKLAGQGTDFYRPLVRLTFALNWYWGQNRVFGYHVVNIGVHIFCAWMLYLTVLALFRTPRLAGYPEQHIHFVALLATTLWAVNPIQTQAVTYIVQRMAAMATLFYVSALYCYLVARRSDEPKRRMLGGAGAVLCFVAALASKENAVMLPLAVLLVEIIFFREAADPAFHKTTLKYSFIIGFFALVCVVVFARLYKTDLLAFVQSLYAHRDFTMLERLLTQPRVILFYLSQLAYPVPSRLSIVHDIQISSSLLSPWTTLPSAIGVLLLIGYGIWTVRRCPLVSFGLLFFFLNHLVESSVLPLEMVFEHRNYLPSLFLFVPIAAGLEKMLAYYRTRNGTLYWLLAVFTTLFIMAEGLGTHTRNQTWRTEKSLWEDAIAKAPRAARPYINLAYGYYQPTGQFEKAIEYYYQGLAREPLSKDKQFTVYNNIGNIYFASGEHEKASMLFARALQSRPESIPTAVRYLQTLIQIDRLDQAQRFINHLRPALQQVTTFLNFKGFLLLKQGQAAQAINSLRQSLKAKPLQPEANLHLGIALELCGNLRQAAWFYKRSLALDGRSPTALFYLIANALNRGDDFGARNYCERLFDSFDLVTIQKNLLSVNSQHSDWTVLAPLKPAVAAQMERLASTIGYP